MTEVDRNPISWLVSGFPVMTLQFSKVLYMDRDSVLTGLINYSDCLQHNELPTTISCKTSCQIHLQDGNESVRCFGNVLKPLRNWMKTGRKVQFLKVRFPAFQKLLPVLLKVSEICY